MNYSIPGLRPFMPRRRRAYQPQAEGLEGRQLLSAGQLDTSFDSDGYALVGPYSAETVRIQPDGKILAAGTTGTNGDFKVVRLRPGGTLDSAFGSGGSVTTDFAGRHDLPKDMVVLADGRIIVAGMAGNVEARPGMGNKTYYYLNNDFGLAAYDTGGNRAGNFGSGGKVMTNISTYTTTDDKNKRDEAYALAVQDDGKIVVGGKAYTGRLSTEGVLVRYNSEGKTDPTFGHDGIIQIPLSGFNSNGVWDLVIQRGDPADLYDDKIVTMEAPSSIDAAGNRHWSVAVARYNLDGTLDTTFGDDADGDGIRDGRTITTMPGQLYAWAMALQPDGSVVLAGDYDYGNGTPSDLMLARYTAAGGLDTTFRNGGIALFDAGGAEYGRAISTQPGDGKFVVAGYTSTSSLLARFQPDGTIDAGFGNGGVALNAFTNSSSSLNALALQPDGKIIAVGGATTRTNKGSTTNFLIARFEGDSGSAVPAVSLSDPDSSTATASDDTPLLTPLLSVNDQDLTPLATEWLRSPQKRGRRVLQASPRLGTL